MVSRMCSSPQIQATQRSMPMPKPPCGTVPYLRRSMYHSKASRGRLCSRMRCPPLVRRGDGHGNCGILARLWVLIRHASQMGTSREFDGAKVVSAGLWRR